MPQCMICGEELKPEQKVCEVCGTSVPMTAGAPVAAAPDARPAPPPIPRPAMPLAAPAAIPSSPASTVVGSEGVFAQRNCPLCHTDYGADYSDEFCLCGGELVAHAAEHLTTNSAALPAPAAVPQSPVAQPVIAATSVVNPVHPPKSVKPPAGTVCLVVYSEQKEPLVYFPIVKDVTLVGRSDPVRGDFPDLDLGELFEQSVSRRISRKHVMVLRSRSTNTYLLRPLAGNTGTQLEKELAVPLQDYHLTSGMRLILGGVVRMKFEVV